MEVRELRDDEREWARALLVERWSGPVLVSHGRVLHADELDALVAELDDECVGLATLRLDGDCEVVTLDALVRRRGVGTALLDGACAWARARGAPRLWLLTTNENVGAQAFYAAYGMRLAKIHPGAVDEARKLKPAIPSHAPDGTPIRDEWEYELQFATPD